MSTTSTQLSTSKALRFDAHPEINDDQIGERGEIDSLSLDLALHISPPITAWPRHFQPRDSKDRRRRRRRNDCQVYSSLRSAFASFRSSVSSLYGNGAGIWLYRDSCPSSGICGYGTVAQAGGRKRDDIE